MNRARRKVREMGQQCTHWSDVPDRLIQRGPFTIITAPVVTLCGVMLGSTERVVVLKGPACVACRACATRDAQPEES